MIKPCVKAIDKFVMHYVDHFKNFDSASNLLLSFTSNLLGRIFYIQRVYNLLYVAIEDTDRIATAINSGSMAYMLLDFDPIADWEDDLDDRRLLKATKISNDELLPEPIPFSYRSKHTVSFKSNFWDFEWLGLGGKKTTTTAAPSSEETTESESETEDTTEETDSSDGWRWPIQEDTTEEEETVEEPEEEQQDDEEAVQANTDTGDEEEEVPEEEIVVETVKRPWFTSPQMLLDYQIGMFSG